MEAFEGEKWKGIIYMNAIPAYQFILTTGKHQLNGGLEYHCV